MILSSAASYWSFFGFESHIRIFRVVHQLWFWVWKYFVWMDLLIKNIYLVTMNCPPITAFIPIMKADESNIFSKISNHFAQILGVNFTNQLRFFFAVYYNEMATFSRTGEMGSGKWSWLCMKLVTFICNTFKSIFWKSTFF